MTDSSQPTGFTQASGSLVLNVAAPTLSISPAAGALTATTAGASYSQTFTASGGTASYDYAVTAGALPTGLTLSAGGTLSGTPTAVGTFNFTVTATDSSTVGSGGPYTASAAYSLTVAAPSISLSPTTLTNPAVGAAYSATVSASGGNGPYTYSTSGSVPPGLSINASTGAITGTPTSGGSFTFSVSAADSSTGAGAPYSGSRSYTVAVGAPTITVSPTSLSVATVGTSYSSSITASGGTAPYGYTVTTGTLPAGLSLNATTGTLSGTPSQGGSFNFTITATDASGGSGPYTGSRSYTLTVNAPTITVSPASLPGATAGAAYSQTITASGGTAPYSYAVTAGALPTGLALATDGTLGGTPTAGGTFNFSVTATDSSTGTQYSGTRAYALTVAVATISIAPTSLPSGSAGTAYSRTLTASGGNGTYSFAVTAGALPAGWSLSSAGVVSGTATETGSFNFTVTATDQSTGSGPYSGSRAYTVSVGSPNFTLTAPTLSAPAGQAYTGNFVAGGGTAPYTYSRVAGTLPTGLTLAADGTLSGAPTATGTFNFTIRAQDSTTGPGSPFAVQSNYNFTVTAPSVPVAGDVSETVAYNSSANPIALALSGGTATSVALAAMPSHGVATVSGLTISYTPAAGYFGADSFTYTATNAGGTSAAATVTITVSPPAAPVVANVTGVAIPYETSGTAIDVSGSITGVHTSVAVVTAPAHGTASVAGDVVTYVPAAGYFGADSFTYTATGPGGTSAPATITLTVATPAAPVAADRPGVAVGFDAGATPIDLSSSITGVHTSIAIVTAPAKGSATISGDIVTYTATPGAFGADSFTFTATGPGGTSAPATVSIIIATPAAPVAAGVGGVAVPYASTGTAIDLSASITGVHTSVAVVTAPAHGTASVAGDVVTYVPAAGYFGADSFTYTATGPGGTSAPATVSVSVGLPPAPSVAAVSGIAIPYASTGTAIDLSASITGVHASVAVATAPTHGTASIAGNVVTYVPAAGYFGADSFAYTATGPGGTSAPATVSLAVGLPPAPTATDLSGVAVPYASAGAAIDLSASVAGVHTGIAVATAPAHGTATVAGYTVTYVPAAGYFGADSLTFTVTGPGGTSAPATVALTVGLPPAPVAANQSGVAVPHNSTGTTIDLAGAIAGVHTSIAIATAPAHGTATVAGDVVTYTPATDYYGEDSFTYAAMGPGGTSAPATVTLSVALPPPPVARPGDTTMPGATTSGGSSTEIDLSSFIDGAATSVRIATPPTHGTVELLAGGTQSAQSARAAGSQSAQALGRVVAVYKPQPGFQGEDHFSFVAVGPGGTSPPATITVSVAGVSPVAQDKAVDAGDGEMVTIDLTAGATGGPFNAATIVSLTPADSATTEIVASGSEAARTYTLRITPAARFDGAIVIRYTLTNAFGASAPASVTVNVDARPDPTADPNVRAISDAQAESTRRFARSQIDNFMQRNESLHNGGGRAGAKMGVRLQALDAGRAFVEPDRYGEQATRALVDRIRGVGGDDIPVNGVAAMRGMGRGLARTQEPYQADAASNRNAPPRRASDDEGDHSGERRIGSLAMWVGGAIEIGTQDRTTGRSKITATSSGLSAGADIKLADNLVIGGGGGWGIDRSDIDGGAAHVRATNGVLAAYGSFAPIKGMFVDGLLATGDLDFRTRRNVAETGALARGVRDGSMTFGALALGIDRDSGDLRWSAYGRAEWLTARLGTYVETGADRMNLRFDERDLTSLSGVLGARLDFTRETDFASVTPRVRAEWRHEFEDGGVQFLDYADIPGPSQYSLGTTGWQRDQFELSLGSALKLPSDWVFDLEMALRGASGERSGALRAKISTEF